MRRLFGEEKEEEQAKETLCRTRRVDSGRDATVSARKHASSLASSAGAQAAKQLSSGRALNPTPGAFRASSLQSFEKHNLQVGKHRYSIGNVCEQCILQPHK